MIQVGKCRINSNHSDNRYYDVPILAYASSDDFAEKVAAAPASAQWIVHGAIRERYAHDSMIASLSSEIDWLSRASKSLSAIADARKGKLSGDRLGYIVEALSSAATKLAGRVSGGPSANSAGLSVDAYLGLDSRH